MRVLGLDTATASTVVALVEDGRVLAREHVGDRRHSLNLLPAMEAVLAEAGLELARLDAVAVGIGPGSFTGIRIGLSAAKALAYALGKPLLGVSSLKALALGALQHAEVAGRLQREPCQICCAVDALKAEIYSARYRLDSEGRLQQIEAEGAREPSAWARALYEEAGLEPFLLLGSGALRYSVMLVQTLGERAWIPRDPIAHELDAAAVARLGLERLSAGEAGDVMSLEPMYCRLSEAELGRLKRPAP